MAHDSTQLLLALALILVAAKVVGDLFERMGQPAVLGEILAGVILGNLQLAGIDGLAFVGTHPGVKLLAELGVIVLLFQVGIESDVRRMASVGGSALAVAVVGVAVPMALGTLVAALLRPELATHAHVFIGAVLTATSVGITARVLSDLGRIQTTEGRIILGAAVIDDVLGLIVLAVVKGLVERGEAGAGAVAWIVVKSVIFLGGAILIGAPLSRRLFHIASWLQIRGLLLALSLAFCFAFCALAGAVGLAAIVGAFAAGLILDEVSYQPLAAREAIGLEEQVRPIGTFLVPIFFVHTGAGIDLRAFADPSTLLLALSLTVAAIAGKQACGLAVLRRGLDRLSIGIGMIPRGEVGLIFAASGAAIGVIDARTNAAVVVMVFLTTLLTPPVLAWSLRRRSPSSPPLPSS